MHLSLSRKFLFLFFKGWEGRHARVPVPGVHGVVHGPQRGWEDHHLLRPGGVSHLTGDLRLLP